MKKIFTLVFSLGLLTSAFAQSEHRQQRQNQGNTYQSSQYSRNDRQDNKGSNTYSYDKNSQWDNNHDRFAYNRNNDKFGRDKNFRDRDERFDSRYKKERRYDNDYGYAQPVRVPLLQIIFGIGSRK
jgi:hypothetical protein